METSMELAGVQVHTLFPTQLFRMRVACGESVLPAIRDEIMRRSQEAPSHGCSNIRGWRSDNDLWTWSEETRKLERLVLGFVDEQVRARFRQSFEFKTYAWANMLMDGAFNQPHVHPGAFLSGVFYVDVGEENSGGQLVLMDPRGLAEMSQLPCAFLAEGQGMPIEPQTGELMLFPGWLRHWVAPYRSQRPRISIGFNVVLQGVA